MSPLDARQAIGGPDKPFLLESEEYFAWLSSRHSQTSQKTSEQPPATLMATFVLSWLKHFKAERLHFLDADPIYLGPGK
jgi:hypothetical protein